MALWIHKVSTSLIFVIGVVHLVRAFFLYDHLTLAAIWFSGAALSMIFAALLNANLWTASVTSATRWTAAGANFLFFFWWVAGVWAQPDLVSEIAALIGATMVISATFLGRPAKS